MIELPASLRDPLFKYDSKWHTFNYGKRRLTSVSKFYKGFKPPFDADHFAQKKADEEGVTPEEIKARWRAKGDRSIALGELVHKGIDAHLKGLEVPGEVWADEDAAHRFALFQMLMDTRLSGSICLASELPVFSVSLGYAGFIDTLLWREGDVFLGDWKNTEKFKQGESGFDNLLPPFDDLKANELNTYAIQSALLRILAESHGLKIKRTFIVHLPPPPAVEAKVYFPPDFRQRVMDVIRKAE